MPSFTNKEVTDLAIRAIAQNRSTNDRVAAVTFLAKNCEEKELPTHQAETLASYILSIKNPQEAEVVYPMMGDLARFRSVPLALADLMEESSIIPSHMERLLSNMLRQEVKLGRDATWRKKARATLVSMALPRADSIPPGDAAQEFLVGSYQEQSKLLGFESVGKTRQPSQVLEWMIQSLASKLARQQWPRDTKRYVDRINDEILAVRFVAVDDMHRTVLLQRVWVKLLCLHAAKLAPTQAQEVNSICDNLDISLRQQHDVLGQLATTEEAIFRLWLVLLTAPETTASR